MLERPAGEDGSPVAARRRRIPVVADYVQVARSIFDPPAHAGVPKYGKDERSVFMSGFNIVRICDQNP
jgi:hypothetical protein